MATLYVSRYKEGAYQSLLEALEHAEDNDCLEVSAGIYDEVLVLRKPVTIHGHGAVCIIGDLVVAPNVKATVQNLHFENVLEMKEATVHFENCCFAGNYTEHTILAQNSTINLTDCYFESSAKEANKAFLAVAQSTINLSKCQFNGKYYAIFAKECQLTIDHTLFKNQLKTHLYMEESQLTSTHSRFQQAVQAIVATKKTTLNISTSYFSEHTMGTQIELAQSSMILTNSQFQKAKQHLILIDSQASVSATLFTETTDTQITASQNSTFRAKHIELTYGEHHAILGQNSAIYLTECKIMEHKGKEKAQIQLNDCQLHIDNTAIYRGSHRAIFATQSELSISTTHFMTHRGVQLEAVGGNCKLTACEFQSELASAILLAEQVTGTINDCAFIIAAKNHITLAAKCDIDITHCRFDRCGGNAINVNNSAIRLQNIIVMGHPSDFPAIFLAQTQFKIDILQISNSNAIALQINDRSSGTAENLTFHNNMDINIDLLNSEAIFKNLTLYDGTYGIYANNSKLTINNIECQNQKLDGIRCLENGHLLLTQGKFSGANQYGLASEYCTLSLEHVNFINNGSGIYTKGATVTLNDSQISKNKQHGICAISSSFNLLDVLFSQNLAIQFDATRSTLQLQQIHFNNGGTALALTNKVNATFNMVTCTDHLHPTITIDQSTLIGKKCFIAGGADYGVRGKSSQITFTDSTFKQHEKDEFYLEGDSEAVLTECEIAPKRANERGATLFDNSTVSLNGYMMYRKRSS